MVVAGRRGWSPDKECRCGLGDGSPADECLRVIGFFCRERERERERERFINFNNINNKEK